MQLVLQHKILRCNLRCNLGVSRAARIARMQNAVFRPSHSCACGGLSCAGSAPTLVILVRVQELLLSPCHIAELDVVLEKLF